MRGIFYDSYSSPLKSTALSGTQIPLSGGSHPIQWVAESLSFLNIHRG